MCVICKAGSRDIDYEGYGRYEHYDGYVSGLKLVALGSNNCVQWSYGNFNFIVDHIFILIRRNDRGQAEDNTRDGVS